MLRNSSQYGRPTRYKALDEARLVNLYCLHRDLKFAETIREESVSFDPEFGVLNRKRVNGYRFTRPDEKTLNYFEVIQDGNVESFPTLNEWLECYKKMIASGAISANDYTVVPLVQVKNKRKHFNTLFLRHDENGVVHVFIIEPRSNNLSRPRTIIPFYPIREARAVIKATFGKGRVKFKNVHTEQQALIDDESCGGYQIGHTEIIANMPAAILDNDESLKRALKTARLSNRNQDNYKIGFMVNRVRELGRDIQSEELETEFETSLHSNGCNKTLNEGIKFHDRESLNPLFSAQLEIGAYLNEHKTMSFSLFGGHTRQITAQRLIEILDTINNSDEQESVKKYKAGLLLFYFSNTIGGLSSKLRDCIERALAVTLGCEDQYGRIADIEECKTRAAYSLRLFQRKLERFKNDNHIAISDPNRIAMHKAIKEINNNDSSIFYKFGCIRGSIDRNRLCKFDAIRTNLDRLLTRPGPGHERVMGLGSLSRE